jgi:hypothetical protein
MRVFNVWADSLNAQLAYWMHTAGSGRESHHFFYLDIPIYVCIYTIMAYDKYLSRHVRAL